jgi:hypothetical protein
MDDSGKEELLFVVIMDATCISTNDENEETFATIIHCIAEVTGIEDNEKKLQNFLLEVLKINSTKSLFVSGELPENLHLNKIEWLRGERYWHEAVGQDFRMFYDEAVTNYVVNDLPNGDTDGCKAYLLSFLRAQAIIKKERKILFLDVMYGRIELTPFLQSIHGDTFNETLPNL